MGLGAKAGKWADLKPVKALKMTKPAMGAAASGLWKAGAAVVGLARKAIETVPSLLREVPHAIKNLPTTLKALPAAIDRGVRMAA